MARRDDDNHTRSFESVSGKRNGGDARTHARTRGMQSKRQRVGPATPTFGLSGGLVGEIVAYLSVVEQARTASRLARAWRDAVDECTPRRLVLHLACPATRRLLGASGSDTGVRSTMARCCRRLERLVLQEDSAVAASRWPDLMAVRLMRLTSVPTLTGLDIADAPYLLAWHQHVWRSPTPLRRLFLVDDATNNVHKARDVPTFHPTYGPVREWLEYQLPTLETLACPWVVEGRLVFSAERLSLAKALRDLRLTMPGDTTGRATADAMDTVRVVLAPQLHEFTVVSGEALSSEHTATGMACILAAARRLLDGTTQMWRFAFGVGRSFLDLDAREREVVVTWPVTEPEGTIGSWLSLAEGCRLRDVERHGAAATPPTWKRLDLRAAHSSAWDEVTRRVWDGFAPQTGAFRDVDEVIAPEAFWVARVCRRTLLHAPASTWSQPTVDIAIDGDRRLSSIRMLELVTNRLIPERPTGVVEWDASRTRALESLAAMSGLEQLDLCTPSDADEAPAFWHLLARALPRLRRLGLGQIPRTAEVEPDATWPTCRESIRRCLARLVCLEYARSLAEILRLARATPDTPWTRDARAILPTTRDQAHAEAVVLLAIAGA